MSAEINVGGPAFSSPGFPYYHDGITQNPYDGHGWAHDPQPGMTLRDWFAGQALAGYFAAPDTPHKCGGKREAEYCYAIADAMLAAREGGQS
jgi:hypothetical protein